MSEPFLGEISIFGGNYPPRGWAFCEGQSLPIAQNTALFSLIGVTYGGDGRTEFRLPDLRGRAAIHAGRGPGLLSRRLGEMGGHQSGSEHNLISEKGEVGKAGRSAIVKAVSSFSTSGDRSAHLGLNYIIALEGEYPSRS